MEFVRKVAKYVQVHERGWSHQRFVLCSLSDISKGVSFNVYAEGDCFGGCQPCIYLS